MKKIAYYILTFLLTLMISNVGLAEFEPIQRGARGERVVEIQLILDELGYMDGGVDGVFGAKTEEAVALFQKENALDATGIVGEATYNALVHQTEALSSEGSKEEVERTGGSMTQSKPAESVTIVESDGVLQIMDAGFDVSYGYLYFAVVIHNSDAESAVLFPTVRITARDAEGGLMGTEDIVMNLIYPEQDYHWAGMAYFEVSEEPSVVEFEVLQPSEYDIVSPNTLEHAEYVSLEIESAKNDGSRFLGEVLNMNDYDIDQVAIVIMFRNDTGTLLAGDITFVDSVRAGKKTPFDMSISDDLVTENYEAFAVPWSLY